VPESTRTNCRSWDVRLPPRPPLPSPSKEADGWGAWTGGCLGDGRDATLDALDASKAGSSCEGGPLARGDRDRLRRAESCCCAFCDALSLLLAWCIPCTRPAALRLSRGDFRSLDPVRADGAEVEARDGDGWPDDDRRPPVASLSLPFGVAERGANHDDRAAGA
jgi:hypothetical protein